MADPDSHRTLGSGTQIWPKPHASLYSVYAIICACCLCIHNTCLENGTCSRAVLDHSYFVMLWQFTIQQYCMRAFQTEKRVTSIQRKTRGKEPPGNTFPMRVMQNVCECDHPSDRLFDIPPPGLWTALCALEFRLCLLLLNHKKSRIQNNNSNILLSKSTQYAGGKPKKRCYFTLLVFINFPWKQKQALCE